MMTAVAGRNGAEFHDGQEKMKKLNFSSSTSVVTPPNTSSLCVGCGSAIYDPFILHVQPDLEWHGRCLNCSKCNRSLGNDPTCFVRDGKAYCRDDYFSTFFYRCAGCHQTVSKSDLVFRVRSHAFHLDCFRCSVCERLLQPGEEIAIQSERLCCLDHIRLPGGKTLIAEDCKQATGCMQSLEQKNSTDSQESQHLQSCKTPANVVISCNSEGLLPSLLNRTTGTVSSETVELEELISYEDLCVLDGYKIKRSPPASRRLQGSRAGLTELDGTDLGDNYRPNSSGSSLGVALRDTDSPLTPSSELSHEDESGSLLGLGSTGPGLNDTGIGSNGSGSVSLGAPLSHPFSSATQSLSGLVGVGDCQTGSGSSSSGASVTGCGDEIVHSISISRGSSRPGKSGSSKRSKDQKTTRVRTVLNEKQLHTLRTCYAANPRPDALMKEQLVEMTSLSPRVIRVWFQNKRCKDKKRQMLLKQMEQHQQSGGRPGALHGISMVAGSPVPNDASLMCSNSGIEVQQIPGPYWKAPNCPNELINRPGSHCNNYKPSSPSNRSVKSKLGRQPTPPPSLINYVSSINGSENPLNYPQSNVPLPGSLMTSLPPLDGSSPMASSVSSLALMPIVPPLPPPALQSPMDRNRFGITIPPHHSNLSSIPSGFTEEPTVPPFQQLMSNFDTSDAPLNMPPCMLTSSVSVPIHDYSKPSLSSPDGLYLPPSSSAASPPCPSSTSTSTCSQLPPNFSLPNRNHMTNNTKLDSLLASANVPACFMPPVPLNGLPLFTNPGGHSPSGLMKPASPGSAATLSLLSSHPSTSSFSAGSYLHTGGFNQSVLGPPPSRAPMPI